jgi:hypothetical protein
LGGPKAAPDLTKLFELDSAAAADQLLKVRPD